MIGCQRGNVALSPLIFPLALAFALALSVPAALAALPDEIQVYTDEINAPGEFGVELHVNTTPSGRRAPEFANEVTPHHGLRVTPEFSWGLTRTLEAGFYLPYLRDAEGRVLFGGPKLRLKWLPLRPAEGGAGWFAGANGEYSWLNRNFEPETRRLELRPIIGWRNPQWLIAANPVLDWPLNGPERGGRPAFNPSFKVARAVAPGVALGAEFYTGLGRLGRPAPRAERPQTLYLALETDRTPLPLHFAIGRGLNDAADKWTVKAILEFAFK
jgi:hypothetical protein